MSPGKNRGMQSVLGRCGIRKAKAQAELNLAWDVKNNMKTFYRYIGQKRQDNVKGELASVDKKKAE